MNWSAGPQARQIGVAFGMVARHLEPAGVAPGRSVHPDAQGQVVVPVDQQQLLQRRKCTGQMRILCHGHAARS